MIKNYLKYYLVISGIVVVNGLSTFAQNNKKKFIDTSNMDLTVKPGDDFYTYANGTWVKKNPVPAKETRWGSFNELYEFNLQAVKQILETAASDKTASEGSISKRVGDFYASAMDSITIEKLGYTPIQSDLEKIKKIKSLNDILNQVAYMNINGIANPMFVLYISQDRKNATKYAVNISQGGTTLNDRDYYLEDDPRSQKIRAAYSIYLTKLFILTGTSKTKAKEKANIVFKIEKSLAEAQMSRIELRDPYKTYNKFTISDFSKTSSKINWADMLTKLKINNQDTVLVDAPKFFTSLNNLLTSVSIEDWKTYLEWNLIKESATDLSSEFVKADFEFQQAQTGQKIQKPRWQRMSSITDNMLGDLLGQLYVAKYFKPDAKLRMDEMIVNLCKAFEIRIKNLEWMSPETKAKALQKLNAFTPKIGYTSKWKNYEGVIINRNTYYQNLKNLNIWKYNEMISRLGKPIDKTIFRMTPPTVNAYYNPVMNEIVFPAGILQFPFFDPNADDAINYGGIGAVIGHELSHGFDDMGSQYDDKGNLKNWWTAEDRTKFENKTKQLVNQFNNYTVVDTIHVLGKLTLGENIGDLGGLNTAYTAFKMTKQGQSEEKIDGFTPDQRFFLSWAQVWRGNILPDAAAQRIKTDPHSPNQYRTIGAPVNIDAWYKAFDVQPGDKLYKKPEDRILIW